MKSLIPVFALTFLSFGVNAQQRVGIFTEDPLNTLHISGTSNNQAIGVENQQVIMPTIRLENLNQENNPNAYLDGIVSTPLSINLDGEIELSSNIKTDIPNLEVSNLVFYKSGNKNLIHNNYILTSDLQIEKESLIHIQAPLSFFLHAINNSTQTINTTTASSTPYGTTEEQRLYTYFKIIDESGVNNEIITGLSDEFIMYRKARTGSGSGMPNTVITESFLRLSPGTYTIEQHYGYDLGIQTKSEPDIKGFMRVNPDNKHNNFSITVYPL